MCFSGVLVRTLIASDQRVNMSIGPAIVFIFKRALKLNRISMGVALASEKRWISGH